MVCWATKSNLSPVELEPSRKCHLLDFQLCENIATGFAVLTCENTATDFSVSNRKDDEPCTVHKVWCSVYTECSAQKRAQDTSHDGLWPKWFEPNSEFEVECSDHLPHEVVSKTLPCERGLWLGRARLCVTGDTREMSRAHTLGAKSRSSRHAPSIFLPVEMLATWFERVCSWCSFSPKAFKTSPVATGAVTTAEACQDCARLAQSRGAPICPLMATLSEKKKESRRGDSIAASMRSVARDVAAKHGAE